MKFILTFLISLPAYSNTFSLKDTGARFDLIISRSEVSFRSEATKKSFPVSKCNEKLAKELNAEILSKLPSHEEAGGLKFYVDTKEVILDSQSELAKTILMMDARMLRFMVEEKAACK